MSQLFSSRNFDTQISLDEADRFSLPSISQMVMDGRNLLVMATTTPMVTQNAGFLAVCSEVQGKHQDGPQVGCKLRSTKSCSIQSLQLQRSRRLMAIHASYCGNCQYFGRGEETGPAREFTARKSSKFTFQFSLVPLFA
ncbi:hypothetical protein E2C01_034190 [Portunus trituberculatus]|uniref:Uncharacterized protein n=1 Tax=Portunus trituberculatus TaxID=210409 RepID=A0A5B7F6A6_PORTR|nr:hypothetical protein [Portunus trituberculatus]